MNPARRFYGSLTLCPCRVSIAQGLDRGVDMSRRSNIVALIIALIFVAVGVFFMMQGIGSVIGWEQASSNWPVMALLAGLILLVTFIIYVTVRNKLSR
jgi:hypothetical protein